MLDNISKNKFNSSNNAKCWSQIAFKINWSIIGIIFNVILWIVSKMHYKYSNAHF